MVLARRAVTRTPTAAAGRAQRARMVLLTPEGAAEYGDRPPGGHDLADGHRLARALCDRRHRGAGGHAALGRPPVTDEAVVTATLDAPPAEFALPCGGAGGYRQ